MTTINTTDDLLSLLNENHEFREAVRRAILTEELMSLPAVFASFVSEVRSDIKGIKEGQEQLRHGQQRQTNDIGELKGIGLETKLYNRGPSLIATLLKVRRSERVRVAETDANSEGFNDVIYQAQDDGIITNDEYERLLDTDMIMRSARKGTSSPVYTAIESSYSVTRDDIEKVRRTASVLRKVFPDAEIHSALYYMNMSSFIETEAVQREVHLMRADNIA